MDYISIFLIALGLAMDASAVSLANGALLADEAEGGRSRRALFGHALYFGVMFGVFQAVMTLIGYFLGAAFESYIETFDHWIAFLLLAFIGGKMLFDTLKERNAIVPAKEPKRVNLSLKAMVVLAVATSLDAMAAGISFVAIDTRIWIAALIIGAVAFVLSALGVMFGRKLGKKFGAGAEIFGSIVLIAIGLKILIEHLFFM